MKNGVRIVAFAALVLAVAGGVWKSMGSGPTSPALSAPVSQAVTSVPQELVHVHVLTGSAKFAFLKDENLTRLLQKVGYVLELDKTGNTADDVARADKFDAVWPAGADAANDFATALQGSSTFPVFSTPLAVASWKKLMPVLEANGLAKQQPGTAHGELNLEKALPLMLAGKRWNQLSDNTVFPVNKGFLVNTPDVRKSNTGAQYIATLAYIANGNSVPSDAEKASTLAESLSPLISRQGFQEGTLSGPFEDYIGQGMGKAPLVLVYESQFVEAKRLGKLTDAHLLLYPQPGLVLKHVLVARTAAGRKLGELLSSDPQIQAIAAQYGFRTNDPAIFAAAAKQVGLDAPELLNLADTPSTKVLDTMNQVLVSKLEGK
ncbi:substrate-binding domain-containing protein [Burkholderia cenocepacia]|uniref:substrate-binding domain-containing protein n=1 Tax=Burkholderia cenocepacia TaxID=95486 RepID=UPI000761E585|nr:substrate-binding domain-containing protein [Burkholderia cenocepacia]KWU19122.1 hypothetical protein AS149_12810 [Burkholderia cenocepacia]